eukprot:7603841-Alexandrium_andersonii.AAC.1
MDRRSMAKSKAERVHTSRRGRAGKHLELRAASAQLDAGSAPPCFRADALACDNGATCAEGLSLIHI